jgi:AraC family transcriptional regulator
MRSAASTTVERFAAGHSFGRCARELRLGGSTIRDTWLAGNATLPRHAHEQPYICVVIEGRYAEYAARRTDECAAGSVVLHPAEHVHANRTGESGARCVNIELDPRLLDDAPLRAIVAVETLVQLGPGHPSLRALRHALARDDSTAPLSALGASLELLAACIEPPPRRTSGGRPRWLANVIEWLESDLSTTPTMEALRQVAGVHPSHLMRAFKQATGQTVGDYLRRRRLEAADARLRRGEALAQVAAATDFCDQAHFTRAYRQHFGVTPGQRRRQLGF